MTDPWFRECRECGNALHIPTSAPILCDACFTSERYETRIDEMVTEIARLRAEVEKLRAARLRTETVNFIRHEMFLQWNLPEDADEEVDAVIADLDRCYPPEEEWHEASLDQTQERPSKARATSRASPRSRVLRRWVREQRIHLRCGRGNAGCVHPKWSADPSIRVSSVGARCDGRTWCDMLTKEQIGLICGVKVGADLYLTEEMIADVRRLALLGLEREESRARVEAGIEAERHVESSVLADAFGAFPDLEPVPKRDARAEMIGRAVLASGFTTPDFLRDDARELRDRAFPAIATLLHTIADAMEATDE